MTGFEPAASCSQSRRATNCATPGYLVFYPAGRILPNQARYQLRYTRIFNFCHDTTARGKNKVFSVCGQSCGQSRFCAAFSNRGKSRKCRCRKALRRFALPYPGYNHGTPKPGAIPTSLYPDIHFSAMIPRQRGKSWFSLHAVKSHETIRVIPCYPTMPQLKKQQEAGRFSARLPHF